MPTSQQIDAAESEAVKMLGGKSGILGIGVVKYDNEFVIKINVERKIPVSQLRAIPTTIEGIKVKISKISAISIEGKRTQNSFASRG